MQPNATKDDFPDMKSHVQMYNAYTGMLTRGLIATIIVLLFIGFVTGVI